jgi:hypothetical protein
MERQLKKRNLEGCIDTRDVSHPLVRKRGENVFEVGESGCLFVPGALALAEQLCVVVNAFHCPGLSNLDAHYDLPGGTKNLFASFGAERLVLKRSCVDDSEAVRATPLEQEFGVEQQKTLLRRLRWISIGQQYNWTTKVCLGCVFFFLFFVLMKLREGILGSS